MLAAMLLSGCGQTTARQGVPNGAENPAAAKAVPGSANMTFAGMTTDNEQWLLTSIETYHPAEQKAINDVRILVANFDTSQGLAKWCQAEGSGCALACDTHKLGGDDECVNPLTRERVSVDYILALHSINRSDYQYQTVSHELGHVLHHAYIDPGELKKLMGSLKQNGDGCYADELGDCIADHEVMADQISRCAGEAFLGTKPPLEWSHYYVRDLDKGKFCERFYQALATKA